MRDNFDVELKTLKTLIEDNKSQFFDKDEFSGIELLQLNQFDFQNWLFISKKLDFGFKIAIKKDQYGPKEVKFISLVVFVYKDVILKKHLFKKSTYVLKFDKTFETNFFSTKQKHNCIDIITRNINNYSESSKLKIESIEKLKSFFKPYQEVFRNQIHEETNKINRSKAEVLKKEKSRFDNEKSKKLKSLDKDDNGVIDIIESDDFMKLFRKHQSVIKEFDKEYLNHLVKISNYLKTKRANIQAVFVEVRKTKNQIQLDENIGLLNNQIHTYELLLFHSLNMIISIVQDDFITANQIYEEFDKLKIFKSDHEKEVSEKLSGIGDGLRNLMHSINSMERNIVWGLSELSYITQDGFADLDTSLTRELQSIDSSLQTNNLLTGIQTYQMYKVNKNTKGLRE